MRRNGHKIQSFFNRIEPLIGSIITCGCVGVMADFGGGEIAECHLYRRQASSLVALRLNHLIELRIEPT
jgi:hypothetical protein